MPKGKPIEPLNIEELESNPSLNGMLAFREKSPALRPLTPTGLRPTGTTLASNDAVPLSDVLAQLATVPAPPRSRGKLIRATSVQDGHSATQDALYWYLWRVGQHVNGSRSRFVRAGYGQLQNSLGIDRSNVQDAIRELQKKLSIRVFQPSTVGTATVYEVFCCEDILASRKRAGLVWAHRFGTRRADLRSERDDGFPPTGIVPIGGEPGDVAPICVPPSEGHTPIEPGGITPTEGMGVTPIHSVKEVRSNKTSSTAEIAPIVQAIFEELGAADDEAARRILSDCRGKAPDATVDEIAQQVRLQARRIPHMRQIGNPIGFLIKQLPKCFEGEFLRQFRETRRRAAEQGRERAAAEEARWQEQAAELRVKLEDPHVSADEKKLIGLILG